MRGLTELLKNWKRRLSLGSVIAALIVLADEIAKEGYTFSINDIINTNITHEKLFIIFVVLAILLGLRDKTVRKKR